MPGGYKAVLANYCYMVQRGKPAASMALQERYIEEASDFVDGYKLNAHVETLSEGWVTFWVYKYEHILEVIKSMPQAPKTAFDHWVLGKLFGYEEAAIAEFLFVKREHS
ncbi:hypothetical protein GCM10025857_34090 [Alicyclobacillus contaminans]|uniref:hypothetical protein n=1 Tax=Alicyclobacillus contaminans TaxID=392016 RepID=UPI00047E2FC9|nr:hypothetical protein [Alicyclobacillus contaminans]GMA52052.1 hypothetical protein GCM10025857_34090 [Alicyclobacillus contaminans]